MEGGGLILGGERLDISGEMTNPPPLRNLRGIMKAGPDLSNVISLQFLPEGGKIFSDAVLRENSGS